jgi:hypothetical protein
MGDAGCFVALNFLILILWYAGYVGGGGGLNHYPL